jgi:hypothetical protein
MSGFDHVGMRSDAMMLPIQMEGAERRNRGIAQIGQSAMSVSELMMRKAESDTRIATFQQERQLAQYKLQQMMALDQAGLSRLQLEGAELQVEGQRLALQEQQRRVEMMDRYGDDEAKAKLELMRQQIMGRTVEERLEAGYVPDEGAPGGWRRGKPDEIREATEQFEEIQKAKRRNREGDYGVRGQMMRDYQRIISQLNDPLQRSLMSPEQQDALRRQAAWLEQQIGQFAGGDPIAGAPTPPPGPAGQTPPVAPGDGKTAVGAFQNPIVRFQDPIVSQIQQDTMRMRAWDEDDFWGPIGREPELRASLAEGIALPAAMLSRERRISPEMAPLYVMEAAKRDPRVFGFIARSAGVPDDQLRLMIKGRYPKLSPEEIDRFIALVDQDTADLLRRYETKTPEGRKIGGLKAWDDFDPLAPR